MRRLFRFALLRRFFASLREEGARAAFRKARIYAGMRLRGISPSALAGPGQGRMREDHNYLVGIWQTLAQEEAFHVESAPAHLTRRRRIALIGDMNLPQCRKYRIEQLAEFWQAQGVEMSYAQYQDVPRCVDILQNATHLMEYRLQTMPVTAMYRYEARRLRLPVLYDLDDPLFSISAYETYENMKAVEPELKVHFISEAPKYLEMMNGADLLTMSTPGLIAHAQLLSPRPVHLRRNFADAATLKEGRRAMEAVAGEGGDGCFRVCFASGSRGHEVDFALISDQVVAFLAGADNRRLTILGHFDTKLLPEGLRDRVETHGFSTYTRYLKALARCDVALMPLTNDAFNRCKSAVRVIDAASVGVPSLVSTVGDMQAMILPGQTGMVLETPCDWGVALDALAADPATARAMGQTARADLEDRWSGAPEPHIIDSEILEWVKE